MKSRLPAGTVTFLFTDVEGSTRLVRELGDDYADILAEHRRALREAFARHGGVEVDTQGDAFFVAFAKATDALAAAAAAREALGEGPIRVRMGLHTGEPTRTDEGYVGIDVHRAARIAAAGHGGQILLSQSTRDLAGADRLRDLGVHRLSDLAPPEWLYQLGDDEFPPLRSLDQTNLPVQPTPFVGREQELADVPRAARDTSHRHAHVPAARARLGWRCRPPRRAWSRARSRGRNQQLTSTLHSLGDLALDRADPNTALQRFAEALASAVATGSRRIQVYCVAGIACARLQQGDDGVAARLWGIAEDQERQLGFRMLSTERQRYERLMAPARERLGDAYDVESRDGVGLTLERAVAEARLHLRR